MNPAFIANTDLKSNQARYRFDGSPLRNSSPGVRPLRSDLRHGVTAGDDERYMTKLLLPLIFLTCASQFVLLIVLWCHPSLFMIDASAERFATGKMAASQTNLSDSEQDR